MILFYLINYLFILWEHLKPKNWNLGLMFKGILRSHDHRFLDAWVIHKWTVPSVEHILVDA